MSGSNIRKHPRQRTISIRTGDKVYPAAFQQLVFQAFSHTAYNSGHHPVPNTLLPVELVDAAPYTLFGIVPYGTSIRHYHVRLFHIFSAGISRIRQNGENDLSIIDIHLASVCFDVYFLA
uniref:Uncharacterized protein n=1 Tax=uncultured prokaryote TaxID=198431 RepID=A0A0H5Q2S6_9ZZZZ|nr:hypothetical protein [uncultured prokaryote]